MLRPILVALSLSAATVSCALAQEEGRPDVLVTADQLAALQQEVDASLKADDCEAALRVLPTFIEKANTHANLIYASVRSVLESPRSNSVSPALENQMRRPLRAHRDALRARNVGWISTGECLAKLGQPEAATAAYLKALDLINADEERPEWDRARKALWALIGVAD